MLLDLKIISVEFSKPMTYTSPPSLGSHLMGKAGRVYGEVLGQLPARITGLDPAGPRFVDGPILDAIPELHENRLR